MVSKKRVTFAEHEQNLEDDTDGAEPSPTKTKPGPTSLNIAARKWARDGDVWVGPILTISPAEELEFCVTDENKETLDILSLTNSSEKYIAFKVKTTSPEKYRVRPSTGVVKPGASHDISVYLHSGHQATIGKDKFLVMFTEISHPMSASQVNELFRTATRDMYNEHRLRCRLGSLKNEIEAKVGSQSEVSQQLAELMQQVKKMSAINERLERRVGRMLVLQLFFLLILLTLGSVVGLTLWNAEYFPIEKHSHNACMPWYAS